MYKNTFFQIFIYGIGYILPKFINFFFLKLFTIKLKLKEYSFYTDMYSISFIIIGFLTFGLESTYFRFLYKKKINSKQVFSTCIIILIFIVSFFLIINLLFIKKIVYLIGYKENPEYFIMFAIIIASDTISSILMAKLRSENMFIKYSLIRIINILIQSFITIILFIFIENSFLNNILYPIIFIKKYTDKTGCIFYSNMIASLITLLFLFIFLFKEIKIKNFNKKMSISMLKYGFPIMLGTLAFNLNENIDKIIIKRILSDNINGAYSACYKIANFMSLYVMSFRLGIEPFLFKKQKNIDIKKIFKEIIYIFIILGIIFYFLIYSNLKLISNIMIDIKYHTALKIVPIILVSNLFLGIYNNISIIYKIKDKTIINLCISILGLIITCIFNLFILIKGFDFTICAWGTFASYAVMLIISYIWSKNNYYIISIKYINKIMIHLILATLTGYYLFKTNNNLLNILGQIIYLLTIIIIERKIFYKIIKK